MVILWLEFWPSGERSSGGNGWWLVEAESGWWGGVAASGPPDLSSVLLLDVNAEEVSEIEGGFGQVRLEDSPMKESRQEHQEQN